VGLLLVPTAASLLYMFSVIYPLPDEDLPFILSKTLLPILTSVPEIAPYNPDNTLFLPISTFPFFPPSMVTLTVRSAELYIVTPPIAELEVGELPTNAVSSVSIAALSFMVTSTFPFSLPIATKFTVLAVRMVAWP
jgi:hypothetical protein